MGTDWWNVMTYDYTVSDIAGDAGSHFNPNCPLYTPTGSGTTAMSLNYSIAHYLDAGVPPSKIRAGIPFYGHTWYAPSKSGDDWKTWGGVAEVQGECCGPFKATYGAKFGKGCQQCGTMMYSEVEAAQPQDKYHDSVTKSDIAYFLQPVLIHILKKGLGFHIMMFNLLKRLPNMLLIKIWRVYLFLTRLWIVCQVDSLLISYPKPLLQSSASKTSYLSLISFWLSFPSRFQLWLRTH